MTRELRGMAVVGEYGSRFDADLAAARLAEARIDAAVVGDPAAGIAPHHVTRRGFQVLVRRDAEELARTALAPASGPDPEADELDGWYYQRRFGDRPAWVRAATWALILAIPVPVVLAAIGLLAVLVARSFPT